MKESEDIERAQETVAAIEEQRRQLDEELRAETASLDAAQRSRPSRSRRSSVKPKKANVTVKLVALVWF